MFCLFAARCLRRVCLRLFIVVLSPLWRSNLWSWCLLSACICHILPYILGVVSSCRLLLIFAYSLLHGYVFGSCSSHMASLFVVTRRGDNKSFGTVGFPKGLCLRGDDLRVFVFLGCEHLSRTLMRAALVYGLSLAFESYSYDLLTGNSQVPDRWVLRAKEVFTDWAAFGICDLGRRLLPCVFLFGGFA